MGGVIMLFPLENLLFWLIWIPAAAVLFSWQATFSQKFDRWFDSDQAQELVMFFTAVYSPVGILVNPMAGLLMDIISFPSYLVGSILIMLCELVSEPIRSV